MMVILTITRTGECTHHRDVCVSVNVQHIHGSRCTHVYMCIHMCGTHANVQAFITIFESMHSQLQMHLAYTSPTHLPKEHPCRKRDKMYCSHTARKISGKHQNLINCTIINSKAQPIRIPSFSSVSANHSGPIMHHNSHSLVHTLLHQHNISLSP